MFLARRTALTPVKLTENERGFWPVPLRSLESPPPPLPLHSPPAVRLHFGHPVTRHIALYSTKDDKVDANTHGT